MLATTGEMRDAGLPVHMRTAEDELARVLEPFYRLGSRAAARRAGSG
jgi:hypothetical protein